MKKLAPSIYAQSEWGAVKQFPVSYLFRSRAMNDVPANLFALDSNVDSCKLLRLNFQRNQI
jgi:hypothetical protein